MGINRLDKKNSSPLFPSDIKRLEEAFLDFSPENKKDKKKRNTVLKYGGLLLLGAAILLFSLKYAIIIIPKIRHPESNLLSNRLLESIRLINKDGKIQFSQGIIYLALPPKDREGFILNTKKSIDLEKNNLLINLNFLNDSEIGGLKIESIVRDEKYFSNTLNPLQTTIKIENKEKGNDFLEVPIDFKGASFLHMNLSEIRQIRLIFYNPKSKPLSLLIKEIKIVEKD
jgi:hypothetical protein